MENADPVLFGGPEGHLEDVWVNGKRRQILQFVLKCDKTGKVSRRQIS
jgi:hypothetical protein